MRPAPIAFLCFFIVCLAGTLVWAAGPRPILVGVTYSKSGKFTAISEMMEMGVKVWLNEVNAEGGLLGRPVRLLSFDDRGDPSLAASYYAQLVECEGAELLLSPFSAECTEAAARVAEKHGMVLLAAGQESRELWSSAHRYLFGMSAPAERRFVGFLDETARNGLETVGLIYRNSDFNRAEAQGVRDWSRRLGQRLVFDHPFEPGGEELPALVARLLEVKPRVVVVTGCVPEEIYFLRLLEARTWRPRAVGLGTSPSLPDFPQRAGSMAESIFSPSQWEPIARIPFPGAGAFVKTFGDINGGPPSQQAAAAYAACRLLERAVRETGTLDHVRLREFLVSLDAMTIYGRFKVDQNGKQIGHTTLTMQWRRDQREIVRPSRLRTAPAFFPRPES